MTAPCLEGADGLCLSGKVSGYYTPGTFQQYVTSPAKYAVVFKTPLYGLILIDLC